LSQKELNIKHILLTAINARYSHSNLALHYLREHISESGWEVSLKEFSINQSVYHMLEEIYLVQPDVVAISVYIWNSDVVGRLICDLKKIMPSVTIVLGGPEVSFNAASWLDTYPVIDYIICGGGEAGLSYLLQHDFQSKDRVVAVQNPPFSELPFPYRQHDFEGLEHKYVYYESSRGCPFRCSYCLSSRSDQRLQYKPVATVKEELSFLMKQSCNVVKFVDRTFNADRIFARQIWQFLIDHYQQEKTFHFEIYPALLQEEDFRILAHCPPGYMQFEIGVQSTNPQTLKEINRNENWDEVKAKVARLIALQHCHIHLDLIVGLPYEDMIHLEQSFNDIYQMKSGLFQLGFLKVLPGTEMSDRKEEYEIAHSVTAPYMILSNKWLSFQEMSLLHRLEGVMEVYYNSGHFHHTIQALERCYDSPFKMYKEITSFKDDKGIGALKDWEKNSTVLLDFVTAKFSDEAAYITDCLRYDWYLRGRLAHLPGSLQKEDCGRLTKKMLSSFAAAASNNMVVIDGVEVSMKALKQAAYVLPDAEQFKQEMMHGAEIILFYKDGEDVKTLFTSADLFE